MESIYDIQRIKQVREKTEVKTRAIHQPKDAASLASDFIGEDDREVFFVMCLNTKNEVMAVHRAHIGPLNSSIAHPREIFKAAILNNAASIIVAHQHPSGYVDPSQEDIEVSQRMKDAGDILGIELLDSVIVTYEASTFTSLKMKDRL